MNSSNDQNLSHGGSFPRFRDRGLSRDGGGDRSVGAGIRGIWWSVRLLLRRGREFVRGLVYWRQRRLHFQSASRCLKGCTSEVNADRCYADQRRGLFIVADGREVEGEQASQTVIEAVSACLGTRLDDVYSSPSDLGEAMKRGVFQANGELMELTRVEADTPTMEAAAVIGIVRHGRLLLCSVGNSRAYLLRERQLTQLTVDDTLVQRLVTAGALTSREAEQHPMRHVLSHGIGTQKLEKQVQVQGHVLRAADRLVFVTDGLPHAIGETKLGTLLTEYRHPAEAVRAVTDYAQEAGSREDVTCIVVDLFERHSLRQS